MSDEMRFTPSELKMVAEQIVTETGSADGKISVAELVSALGRAVNREESEKFKARVNRDSFGRIEVKKVV